MSGSSHPEFSILIGRVSTEDHRRVLEALDALRAQDVPIPYEVVIVDRRDDEVTAEIRENYPEVRLSVCPRTATLPEMRTVALGDSTAPFVAVTEDHCVPPSDWLRTFQDALNRHPDTVVIAGCVINGVKDRALDWATYLCEYTGTAPPVPEGPNAQLAGMNVVYRRAALEGVSRDLLQKGFWETTVHPVLAARHQGLMSTNHIRIFHCKKFSFRLFAAQRFIYSRYFAGIRFTPEQRARRMLAAVITPVLPLLLVARLAHALSAKQDLRGPALRALPYLLVFFVIWAAGEIVGYVRGPGDALRQIE